MGSPVTEMGANSTADYALGESSEIQRRLQKATRYYNWIRETIRPFLGNRVLEVGCGDGLFTRHLLDREKVVSIDVSQVYVQSVLRQFKSNGNHSAFVQDVLDPSFLRLKSHQFDTLVCLNVLEHLEDDLKALRHMRQVLTEGGRVILQVPALPILYGEMDKADRHFRRYTRKELETKLRGAGFMVEQTRFFNFVGTFGWFINGKVLRRKLLPEKQLGFFDRLVPFLAKIESMFPIPFGQSLMAIGRTPVSEGIMTE